MNIRLLCFFAAILPLRLSAVTRTWDGGGADDNWGTAANWNPDGAPANGDDLTFGLGVPVATTNNLTGRTFGLLSFLRGTTVAGNAFTLTGGMDVNPATGGNAIVTANLTLGANQTFNVDRNALELNGSAGFGSRVLTVTGGGALVFNGLAGSSTAGAKLIKNGSGRLTVASPAIVFLPAMDFTAGTLQVLGSLQTTVNMTGGKLTGDGQLTGLNATAGDIEPAAAGLRVAGNTTLGGTARCVFHLAAAGDANSLDVTSGSVTLNGASLVLDVTGVTPPHGASYQLLSKTSAGAVTGTFAGMPEGTEVRVGSSVGRLSYTGGNGNDVVLTIISATQTWDGGATLNDNWDDPQNWLSNTAPAAGDVLIFPDGIGSTDRGMDNNFPNDTVFRQLVFNGDDFTVRGNRFKLSDGMVLTGLETQTNLDTSVVLTRDQTIEFRNSGIFTPSLHLGQLDEIDTAGHILTLKGRGRIDGKISGTGGILVPAGSDMYLPSNSTYTGDTTVESGANLSPILDFIGSPLGTSAGRTFVHGTLTLNSDTGFPYSTEEPFVLYSGGSLQESGSSDLELKGPVELSGPGDMRIGGSLSVTVGSDKLRISGEIRGTGDLEFFPRNAGSEKTFELIGPVSNTFAGSLRVTGCTLIADKSNPGVLSVPCADLFIGRGDPGNVAGVLETRKDEQLADNCHVHVEEDGELWIGNVVGRTETIGSLTLAPHTFVSDVSGSLLIVGGNISARACFLYVDTRVTSPVAEVNVPVDFLTCAKRFTRSGSATVRKTGAGRIEFRDVTSVPLEVQEGEVIFESDGSGSPVSLRGGTVSGGSRDGATGRCGNITSLAGGGTIGPKAIEGSTFFDTAIFQTGSLSLNSGTSVEIEISNAVPGIGHDQINVSGSVALGGARLEIGEQPDFVVVGANLTIMVNDGTDAIGGTFAGLPEGAFIPVTAEHGGGGFTISYTGGDGNDVVLDRSVAPPVEVPPVVTTVTFGNPDAIGTRAVTIAGKGTPGASYRLENSVSLQQWTPIGTAQTANAVTGALSFSTVANPHVSPKQFYRFRKL